MSEYIKIFVSFFKIGLFTFGGGYAMLPMFRQELIEKHRYITEDELVDYYSIGQCTPGVIAVNVATFTGYKIKHTKGAILATFAIILPSLIIILALAGILQSMSQNMYVIHAFAGIRLGVIALIFNETIKLFQKTVVSKYQLIIFISVALLLFGFQLSAIAVVLLSACVGILKYIKERQQ